MTANVMAEATGRLLAPRLYEMTDDRGIKDMLSFLIHRDSMHQNQWLAVIVENGGMAAFPVPNSFPQSPEVQEFSCAFVSTAVPTGGIAAVGDADGAAHTTATRRWTHGTSLDGRGQFHVVKAAPLGQEPVLSPAPPSAHAQKEEMTVGATVEKMVHRVGQALGV